MPAGQKIIIDPVTRVEGHGKVTVNLDNQNRVENAYFHIVEFRGFERFIQGHPYWEAPVLVQRLCGICPVSHYLAAAKAIDQIVGVDPEDLSPTASALRRLLHYAQIFQSHALHFFYLASPDLLYGADAPAEVRNVMHVAMDNKELARKGILMTEFGHELIKAIAGKKIHGISAVPGGVQKTFTARERDYFLEENDTPSAETMIKWSNEIIDFIRNYHDTNHLWLDTFASYPSGHLGLVSKNGDLEFYDGRMRAIDANGNYTLTDIHTDDYLNYFSEAVEKWSYMKFPYLKRYGKAEGWNRVGPLARLNVAQNVTTPLARRAFLDFKAYTGGKPNTHTLHSHWARLIEILHCAEIIRDLLNDPMVLGDDLIRKGNRRPEGIGIVEAPRGTLIHHYEVDEKGMITKCNLIVSTTHNNEAMNRAVRWVAKNTLDRKKKITEGMLNEIEVAIRAYDPCLSCATHALGQMPLQLQIYDHNGQLVHEISKN